MKLYVSAAVVITIAVGAAFFVYGQEQVIPFQTITRGQGTGQGNILGKVSLMINDQATWQTVWVKAFCFGTYCSNPPTINFTTTTVLAVFSGVEPTGGYNLSITRVALVGSTLLVHSILDSPSHNCQVTETLTSPYHLVGIPKTTVDVKFDLQTTIGAC